MYILFKCFIRAESARGGQVMAHWHPRKEEGMKFSPAKPNAYFHYSHCQKESRKKGILKGSEKRRAICFI